MQPTVNRARLTLEQGRGKLVFFLTILLGAISVLGHAPFFIWPAFILAIALFMGRLNGLARHAMRPGRAAFWAGWAFGFGFFIASLYWLASAFITRGGGYVWLTPIGVLALPAALAFFWALASLIYVKIFANRSGIWRALAPLGFALTLFCMEWLRGHILSGFPWNLPGYIWEAGKPISQIAHAINIYGLSLLTLLFAAALGQALFCVSTRKGQRYVPFLAMSILLTGLWVQGQARLSNAVIEYVDGPYIRVVQAQIDQQVKYNPSAYSDTIDQYLDLSLRPSEQAITHVIWPEGALAGMVLEDQGLMAAFDQIFTQGPHLIMGVTRRVPQKAGYKFYNSLVALRATSRGAMEITARYNKSKLVPFGEYFPGNKLFTQLELEGLSAATASFDHGERDLTLIPGLPLGSMQICYEAIFPGFTPNTEPGAPTPQFILNISNDSWFGKSTGPHQHFNQVRYRAIEEGLPVIRSASSGFSGFVDPYGRILSGADISDNTVIDNRLPKPLKP